MTTYGNLQNDRSQRKALEDLLAGTAPLPAGSLGPGSVPRLVAEKLADRLDVRDFGASASRSDNEVPIQAAIDYAASLSSASAIGRVVYLPDGGASLKISSPIYAKNRVMLVGAPWGAKPTNSALTRVYCDAGFSGPAMVQEADETFVTGFGIKGIEFVQSGTPAYVDAVRLRDPVGFIASECCFLNIGGRAIALLHDAGSGGANPIAAQLNRLFVYSSLLDTTTLLSNAANTGAIHLEGVDHSLVESEIGRNVGSLSSASMYGAGLFLPASSCRIGSNCVFQLSDVGIRITGHFNNLINFRSDRNYGHGMIDAGTNNAVANGRLLSNGYGTLNTYDGFTFSGQRGLYSQLTVNINDADNGTTSVRYGFVDTGSNTAQDTRNSLFNCFSRRHGTGQYLYNISFPSHIDMHDGAWQNITLGSGVTSYTAGPYGKNFNFTNGAARTITNFFGIPPGMALNLLFDGNTTVTHGAFQSNGLNNRFVLAAGSDQTPAAGIIWRFRAFGNNLVQEQG